MVKQFTHAVVILMVFLTGCDSFTLSYERDQAAKQRERNGPQPDAAGVTRTNPVDTESSVIEKLTEIQKQQKQAQELQAADWCPRYKPPYLPQPPVAPLDKLNQLKPSDTAAIEALERNYIVDLNQWIARSETVITRSYRDYLTQCEITKKKHQQE